MTNRISVKRGSGAASPNGPSGLQVLDRTFAVLTIFTSVRPEWTTTEIAKTCGLPIPTAHRIVTALRAYGFLSRDNETKRFRLGPAALELGDRARSLVDIREVARPVLRRLAHQSGETALLTALNDERDRSVCLERVESPQPLRLSVQPGRQLPLNAGASQKILLAFMPEEERERLVSKPLERLCGGTITDPQALRSNLKKIRLNGYANSLEETNTGAWGVAVPVLDPGGGIVAGIGLAGPSARLSEKSQAANLRALNRAAVEIAKTLGMPANRAKGGG